LESRVIENRDGSKILEVYYCRDDFDRAIEAALQKHGLSHGDISVVSLPLTLRPTIKLPIKGESE
jgi:hypothetical protein